MAGASCWRLCRNVSLHGLNGIITHKQVHLWVVCGIFSSSSVGSSPRYLEEALLDWNTMVDVGLEFLAPVTRGDEIKKGVN